MTGRPGASAGVAFAGVALAATFLPWRGDLSAVPIPVSTLAGGVAVVALAAFLAGRYGTVSARVSAPVAGVASVAVVLAALSALVAAGEGPFVGNTGAVVALAAGVLGVPAAVAEWFRLDAERLAGQVAVTLAALGIGGLALILAGVVSAVVSPIVSLFSSIAQADAMAIVSIVVTTLVAYAGMALVAVGYLAVRDLDLSYVDIEWPSVRDLAYAVGGTLVLLGGLVGVSLLFRALGVPVAESSIQQQAETGDPTFLLALIPLSYVAIAPGEELVFRNVVQKYLGERFSEWGAVVVASVVFAAVHFLQYASSNPLATLSSLATILVLSLVLGAAYERTDNLTVPIFVHGTFNAIQFAVLYAQVTGMAGAG